MTTLAVLINQQAARLVPLAVRFAAQHGERVDLEFVSVTISRWRIVIEMRPRPVVIEVKEK